MLSPHTDMEFVQLQKNGLSQSTSCRLGLYAAIVSLLTFHACQVNKSEIQVSNFVASTAVHFPAVIRIGFSGRTCTATFIGAKTLLTAAHCLRTTLRTGRMQLRLYKPNTTLYKVRSATFHVHPNRGDLTVRFYKALFPKHQFESMAASDVALLVFAQPPFKNVALQALKITPLRDRDALTLVGYGNTDSKLETGASENQHVGFNVYHQSFVGPWSQPSHAGFVSVRGLSQGEPQGQGQSSLGSGDSGGPLLDANGHILGVASGASFPLLDLMSERHTDSSFAYLQHPATQEFLRTALIAGADIPFTCCRCREQPRRDAPLKRVSRLHFQPVIGSAEKSNCRRIAAEKGRRRRVRTCHAVAPGLCLKTRGKSVFKRVPPAL